MIKTDLITTLKEGELKSFLSDSINNFIGELLSFAKSNVDPTLLGYSSERSLLSFFISGLYRHYKKEDLTAIQEYRTVIENNTNGRPDAFIKYKKNAILIESKFQDLARIKKEEHWDIDGWLKWDKEKIYDQLNTYYEKTTEKVQLEKKISDGVYEKIYLITMVFKYIGEDPEVHKNNAEDSLKINNAESNPDWYYLYCGFSNNELENNGNKIGVEIYGTVRQMQPGAER